MFFITSKVYFFPPNVLSQISELARSRLRTSDSPNLIFESSQLDQDQNSDEFNQWVKQTDCKVNHCKLKNKQLTSLNFGNLQ